MAQDFKVSAAGNLFARVSQTPAVQSLARRLEHGGALPVAGVCASAQPFLAALLRHIFPGRPIVFVTDSLKTQELFHQDVTTWLEADQKTQDTTPLTSALQPLTLFYPPWDVLPHEGKLPHADTISDRLATLVALSAQLAIENRQSPIITTSLTALLQRTFPAEFLHAHTRTLKRGDHIDPLDLIEWLEEQGYEPEAQVTHKGEIALRGGILDVFPLTNPWPMRLEFFGNELESLRQFDPLTQISREEIPTITLPPSGELGLLKRDQERGPASGTASTQESNLPSSTTKTDSDTKTSHISLATILDYLPRETIFLLCDPETLALRAEEYAQQVPPGDPFFIPWEEFLPDALHRGMTVLEITEANDEFATLIDDNESLEDHDGRARQPIPQRGGLLPAAGTITNDSEIEFDLDITNQHPPLPPLPKGEGRGEGKHNIGTPDSPLFITLDAYRPLATRVTDPQIAEAQRCEFFNQLHRWLRQDYAVHVVCNNEGERQRFNEIWQDTISAAPKDTTPHSLLTTHLGALSRGFLCEPARLVVVTDAEIFGRYRVQRPRRLKSSHAQAMRSAFEVDFADLEEGDLVVHLQHGIGRYLGLKTVPVTPPNRKSEIENRQSQECLAIEYASTEPGQPAPRLYVPVTEAHLVGKYIGAGKFRPPLNTLGGTRWAKAKEQAEHAVRDVAAELLAIQAARESQAGHAFKQDTPWQREFEGAFIYEETVDQVKSIAEVKADMERPKPMDRLICGDAGFGKTEVAIRAAFKAVMDGRQVAVLVPTTVLAQQHFNTFRERMADYPVRIDLLSRYRSRREQQKVVKDLVAGAVDIVIGTHRLVQDDIVFKDLGLVVIDEEQRFGVLHKEKFKRLRTLVDVLTLSATPIPRTLYLALTGARDMSTIQTPPHDRLPVETIVTNFDERLIRDAIQREINRGGQVFFLHNRVTTIEVMANRLKTLLPQARIVVGHGQMHSDDLEEVMTRFVNGEADVLLSTTIVESGLDIPNANTIIIDRADRFGLSDLYQLRGRVGRYKHQAYAYLLLPRHARLLTDVRKRISAIKQYSTLGSGFKIAMRDLEIRGAGNLLGAAQSGHITAVGFELYCQLLKQSVASLKGEKVKPRKEVSIRLDFLEINAPTALIPSTEEGHPASSNEHPASASLPLKYVPEPQHRIEFYRKLAQATDKTSLDSLTRELRDRFGPLPPPVELLLLMTELRILAGDRNVTVVEVKEDKVMLTRHGDYLMLSGKFPRLTKKQPAARLKEIKKLLLAMN